MNVERDEYHAWQRANEAPTVYSGGGVTDRPEDAATRFCVCGHSFDLNRPETRQHDHAARTAENHLRSMCVQVDRMVEEEAARRV